MKNDLQSELSAHPEFWAYGIGFAYVKADLEYTYNHMKTTFLGYRRSEKKCASSVIDFLNYISPPSSLDGLRVVLIACQNGYTYIANSRPGGPTDPGYAMLYARKNRRQSIFISNVESRQRFGENGSEGKADVRRQFVIYEPGEGDRANERRGISVSHTQGKWHWDNDGVPFSFENQENYKKLRAKDRFTREMLLEYCDALKLHPFSKEFYGTEGYLLEFDDR